MTALEVLLERRWIIKDKDPELYYKIKDEVKDYRKFITEKLGFQLIITPHLIKVEKLPGMPKCFMGLPGFTEQQEYIILCMILMFLEDRGKYEQFVLSQLTEFIEAQYPVKQYIDWTVYSQRKALIKVLRYITEEGILRLTDGEVNDFVDQDTTEVLYENTGISRYFVRRFMGNIMNYNRIEDFRTGESFDIEQEKGIIRRHRVYRQLVMEPVLYNNGIQDEDFNYVKYYRHMIEQDLKEALDVELHVHKNMALMMLPEDTPFKDSFPGLRNIYDIILQVSKLIREQVTDETYHVDQRDCIYLSEDGIRRLIQTCKHRFGGGWSKGYRELTIEKLMDEIMEQMQAFNMLKKDEEMEQWVLLPLVAKMIGDYPEDYWKKLQEENNDGSMEN